MVKEKIQPIERVYYKENFDLESFDFLKSEVEKLINYDLNTAEDIIEIVEKYSEFSRLIEQHEAWKYIRMTQYADNDKYAEEFNQYYENVVSPLEAYNFKLNQKIYNSPLRKNLDEKKYGHMIQMIVNDIEMFREENLPIKAEIQKYSSKYGALYGGITVPFDGEEKTLIQMGVYSKNVDRVIREKAYRATYEALLDKKSEFNEIFEALKGRRIKLAKNTGFENYRDYKHKEMGRFSYTPKDIETFHTAVKDVVIPFLKKQTEHRKNTLKLDSVRPWDVSVSLDGKVLKPFKNTTEFIDKAQQILFRVKPKYGQTFEMMKNTELLDLENRKGKAPGGYNYPLEDLGSSFIFMNSVGLHRDVVTLLHEAGHAMHSYAMRPIKNHYYRGTPSEIAELASMAMELLTMEHWHLYYDKEEDFVKAKREQLEGTLSFLPWCMIVDAFQQWIYTNPNHTSQERDDYFLNLLNDFNDGLNYNGIEDFVKSAWLRQLHIFEVPFYYIEYGMAQLGALAVYKNYIENGTRAIDQYDEFLKTGYEKPLKEVYEKAGIKFDFSSDYIKELVDFVERELSKLK